MDEERLFSNIKSHLQDDPISAACLNNQSDPKWTVTSDGLLHYSDWIYVPNHGNLQLCVLQYSHDHPLAGHFGQTKILHTVWMQYAWPGLPVFIKDYCKSCTTCSCAKPVCHQPYGLLKQLPVPEKPWNWTSLDFIEKLPPSSSGYTTIPVIVDCLSKQGLFIPTHDMITSQQLAQLFILHVFSKHRIPSHITSDCRSEFVSHFFRSLRIALDMKLHFTSGYHPEGDGQTEWTNQTLEQYIWVYCNYQQNNWDELPPFAEFAYNNTPSATTGITPFFTNKGYHLNLTVHPECDLASARARDFVTDLDELHQELQKHILDAQCWYQLLADSQRLLAPEFKTGSQAFVKAQFFCMTWPSKKLSEKFLGLYEIIARPGSHSVTLQLPDSLRAVHLGFHISMLEPAFLNTIPDWVQPPPPPVMVNDKLEFKISKILDTKIDNVPANYCTLSVGQATKAQTKKPCGYLLLN